MRILVTGGSGFVGSYLIKYWLRKHPKDIIINLDTVFQTTASSRYKVLAVDICNANDLKKIEEDFDVVVHCAAYTDVDGAERERGNQEGKAWTTNVLGSETIAKFARGKGAFLVHISTDFTFPAHQDGPFSEGNRVAQTAEEVSWYGWTKAVAERKVQEVDGNYAIVRIAYPFGNVTSKKDFAIKTLSYIKAGYTLFSDQLFTPTFIPDLAKTIEIIIKRRLNGTYHVACQGLTTPYEFGRYLARKTDAGRIKEGSMKEFLAKPGATPRLRLGGLLSLKTQTKLGITFASWQQALDKITPQLRTLGTN